MVMPASIPALASGPLRLLISARDPGAAMHLGPICRAASQDPRFSLSIVAQPPAADLLHDLGLPVRRLPALAARDPAGPVAEKLLRLADALLHEFRPDVLLCGLSSPGEGGIDEALLARRVAPALLMQDFWGEQNTFFGRSADKAIVLDVHAAQVSQQRHGLPSLVAGSPRHADYAGMNFPAVRARIRALFQGKHNETTRYIGLFTQPLDHFGGYWSSLNAWAECVRALPFATRVIHHPHPRESAPQRARMLDWLEAQRLDYVTIEEGRPEEALVACDAACTLFSNCAYDAAYLNFFSDEPLVTPVLMLFDSEIRDFLCSAADLRELPYVRHGLARTVWSVSELSGALFDASSIVGRQAAWEGSKAHLQSPQEAVQRILREAYALAHADQLPEAFS
jgi:hypothetical protein